MHKRLRLDRLNRHDRQHGMHRHDRQQSRQHGMHRHDRQQSRQHVPDSGHSKLPRMPFVYNRLNKLDEHSNTNHPMNQFVQLFES
jgi:hypothetical protein